METRYTEQTGITISAQEVYSASGKRNVVAWAHYDNNGGHPRKVGPWYRTKAELLADHEDYLRRAGWLKDTASAPIEPTASLMRTASWVIRDKASKAVVCETFESRIVECLNTAKYEAVPILAYLQEVTAKIREQSH